MDTLNILLIIYLLMLLLTLLVERKKICTPSVIMMASFTFMISLAVISNDYLGIELKEKTAFIMTIAAIFFIATELFVENLVIKKTKPSDINDFHDNPIVITKSIQTLTLLFNIFCLLFSIYVIFGSTSGSFAERMYAYKTIIITGGTVEYLFIVNQLYKIALGLMYILGYILIYNYTIHNIKITDNRRTLTSVILFSAFAAISQGARQPLIEYFVFLCLVYLLLKEKENDKKSVFRFIVKTIPFLIITGLAFYYSMTLVGRAFHEGKSVIHYIAEYFSGGLYKFNQDIDYPAISTYFGKQSLKEFYASFVKLGVLSDGFANFQPEFDKYGNTVTMYGRWYEDWGIAGVLIMCILSSFFFTILYLKAVRFKNYIKHWNIVLYAFLVIALVWAGYDDRIKAVITLTTFYKLLSLYFFIGY